MSMTSRPADPDADPPTDDDHGRRAEAPTKIPASGWRDVLVRTKAEAKQDNVTLLAGGVAFFGLLALVPGLVALVSVYGLVADPQDVEAQVEDVLGAAPTEVRDVITQQLGSITGEPRSALGLAAIISLAVALWSASSGVKNLIAGINAAYDEDDSRGFLRLRSLSLLLTVGAIVLLVGSFVVIAVLPPVLESAGLGPAGRLAAAVVRWVLLLVAMVVALAVLYRLGPDRDDAAWSWVTPGAALATVVWLLGSAAFAVYTASLASYNETYGSLGAVVVVMLWLYLTALAVLLGAEVNAELERQTASDTTTGRPRRLGERDATAADTVGPTADEVRAGASTEPDR